MTDEIADLRAKVHALTIILNLMASHHPDRPALRRALTAKRDEFLASAAEEAAHGDAAAAAHDRAVAAQIGVFDDGAA